jgi:hypothetical protein
MIDIEDILEAIYTNSGYIYILSTAVLLLYGIFIQLWLIVCVSVASTIFAVITFIRYKKELKKRDEISKKIDQYTLEQKKEIAEKELPSPLLRES